MDPTAASPGSNSAAPGPPGPVGPPDASLIPSPPTQAALDLANVFAGIAITFNVISFLLFVGRMWTRSFPVFRLGWDDYIISAAYVLVFVNSLLLLLTVPFVFGRDPATITLQDVIDANRYAVLSQPIWAWAMAAVKISVAAMLLRVEPDNFWRRFLWVMIALQLIVCAYNTFVQVLQCIPLHAAWDLLGLVKGAKCWSKDAIRISSICVSTFHIVTDVIFALMPITFLRKVQRPLRERIIIGILMALGVFASVASIMKAIAAANFGRTNDPNTEGIAIGTWSCVEEQIGFMAACIPCLRSPFQALLQRFGLASVHNTASKPTAASRGYGRMHGGNDTDKDDADIAGIRMGTIVQGGQSEESILAPGSQHVTTKSGEIWRTTEVRLEEGVPERDAGNEKRRKDDFV